MAPRCGGVSFFPLGGMISPGTAHPASIARSDPFQILVAEHDLLRHEFARILEVAQLDDGGWACQRASRALLASVRRHQRREDRVLYPVCERLFGGRDGAAAVLKGEHAAILEGLAGLLDQTNSDRVARRARAEAVWLRAEDHFGKEERVLFPLTAALLSGTESTALARRLRFASDA